MVCRQENRVIPPKAVTPGYSVFFKTDEDNAKLYPASMPVIMIMGYQNDDQNNNCGKLYCELLKPGCKVKYDGTNLKIDPQSKLLNMNMTNPEGYTETVCITCDNYEIYNKIKGLKTGTKI